jgi:uncharacterized membrane protein
MKYDTYLVCHGYKERCLCIGGYKMPFCARCTAIYFGMICGLILEMILGLPGTNTLPYLILLIVPCGIDGITQLVMERKSTNAIRLLTGFPSGIGLIITVRMMREIII